MFTSVAARIAIKRLPPLKRCTLSRHLSLARTTAPVCSLLPEYKLSRPSAWLSVVLLTALVVTASAPTIGTALAKEGPDAEEDTITIVN